MKGQKGIRILAPMIGTRKKKDTEANKDISKQNQPVLVGFRAVYVFSVAHYGEQNDDAMRDPKMCFELGFRDGPELNHYTYRKTMGAWSNGAATSSASHYVHLVQLHEQHQRFANVWDSNLRLQGYAETFDPQKHVRGSPFPSPSFETSADAGYRVRFPPSQQHHDTVENHRAEQQRIPMCFDEAMIQIATSTNPGDGR